MCGCVRDKEKKMNIVRTILISAMIFVAGFGAGCWVSGIRQDRAYVELLDELCGLENEMRTLDAQVKEYKAAVEVEQ